MTAAEIKEMGSVKKVHTGEREIISAALLTDMYGAFCVLIQLKHSNKAGEQMHTLTFTISYVEQQ